MCMWASGHACVHYVLFTACVRSTGAFDLVNVNTCVFILYLCRACWLLNILSGHVKCERNRAQDVQLWPSACSQSTHSLTLSLSHLHAHSLIFVSTLPPTLSSPLPLNCNTWHNGPIIVPFCSSVTSADLVFVLGHHVKFASVICTHLNEEESDNEGNSCYAVPVMHKGHLLTEPDTKLSSFWYF